MSRIREIEVCYDQQDGGKTQMLLEEAESIYPFRRQLQKIFNFCNGETGFLYVPVRLRRIPLTTLDRDRPVTSWFEDGGIAVDFNSAVSDCIKKSRTLLPGDLAHEFAHYAQDILGVRYPCFYTLGDLLVMEGIADYFALAHFPNAQVSSVTHPVQDMEKFWQEVYPWLGKSMISDEIYYLRDRYGDKLYTLGFDLVQKFKAREGLSLKQLLLVKANEVLNPNHS